MLRQFITRCQHVLCLHCAPRLPHQLHSLSPLILTKTCSFFLCLSHTHSTSHAQPKKSIRHVSVNSQCPARHLISEHRNSHLSRALPHSPSSSLSTSPSLTQPSTLSLPLYFLSLSPPPFARPLYPSSFVCNERMYLVLCVRLHDAGFWHVPLHVEIWEESSTVDVRDDSGNSIVVDVNRDYESRFTRQGYWTTFWAENV